MAGHSKVYGSRCTTLHRKGGRGYPCGPQASLRKLNFREKSTSTILVALLRLRWDGLER